MPTFGLTCWPTCWCSLLYYCIFSKQKAINILGFSFICLLTIYQECQSVKQQYVCLIIALMIDDDDKKNCGWTRKWIRRREEEKVFANLNQELLVQDTRTRRELMRMSHESFKKILGFIEPHITPKDLTVIGAQLIRQAERLVLAIRFLYSGHWGINTPSKAPPPSVLPSPPWINKLSKSPLFRQSPRIYWFVVTPPPPPPEKLDLSVNPKGIKVFHP